ncbi:hypothetical protein O181_028245 [Austropuccinia psidii MF-1]|uniref:Uncharacterized protein n=1 Tax=Austropuccinia psidii MF-1 TaxID=1389203 RepID=A0A9Q3H404_9BASI|nr:hypothetical protein [Austropuccinia psidii MF-1]
MWTTFLWKMGQMLLTKIYAYLSSFTLFWIPSLRDSLNCNHFLLSTLTLISPHINLSLSSTNMEGPVVDTNERWGEHYSLSRQNPHKGKELQNSDRELNEDHILGLLLQPEKTSQNAINASFQNTLELIMTTHGQMPSFGKIVSVLKSFTRKMKAKKISRGH